MPALLDDMERWFQSADRDMAWIVRENLKKAARRMDTAWVARWREMLG